MARRSNAARRDASAARRREGIRSQPLTAPGGVERQGLDRHVEGEQLARAGERHVERAVAEAAVRGLASGAHLDDVPHLSVRLEDDYQVAQAAGGVEPPGGVEAEAVGEAPR